MFNLFKSKPVNTVPQLIGELRLRNSNKVHGIYKTVNGTYYYMDAGENILISKGSLDIDYLGQEVKSYLIYN